MESSFLAMARPRATVFTDRMTEPTHYSPDLDQVVKAIARRSFCMLATVSRSGRPHVAGVLYQATGTTLYVNMSRDGRKGRNIAENPHVAVSIPIRRLPVGGPPSTVQFQGRAEMLGFDDPEIVRMVAAGELKKITSHGELDHSDGCFVRITPQRRMTTYGLGMSLLKLIRDPLHAGGTVELEPQATGAHR
jgi:predicted pyridoxine 5'-phosphate oxidase superfamily flavin-nucleotide-binding protein